MGNKSLRRAKREKKDEFYTRLTDIEKELQHYRKHFKDKIIFCNCDDPEYSDFWQYFYLNFDFLGSLVFDLIKQEESNKWLIDNVEGEFYGRSVMEKY